MTDTIHRVRPHCQSIKHMPAAKLDDQPNRGCFQRSRLAGESIGLTAATFPHQLERSDIPLRVDIGHHGAGPAR